MLKNLKKVISTIAAVAILATSASAFAVTFPDVDASASYASDVELLTALGVVNGDENGKFNPDNTVTRAEFAKMVVEALGKGEAAASSSYTRFADAQGHWAAGYIEAGVAAEFINGYDENTFGPDDTVTFAQAVKMLVGAAGYESWAQMAGGWKAGYMSYGSTLGIMKGVNVAEDAALTRAECATLIANAMKAPLLVVEGYYFEGTMNGVVQVPNYVPKDDEGKGWQTMLTKYHDAYVVYGRVSQSTKETSKKGTVLYSVEETKNVDDKTFEDYTAGDYEGTLAYVGDTNADDMLFEYTEAVLVKDEDTDEYTLASIKPYGASEKLEVAAKLVDDITTEEIKVLKSETSTKTKDYDLEGDVKVYVNGYKLDDIEGGATALTQALAFVGDANPAGVVTLIDETDTASTATNGDYDVIMITYTISDKVEYAEARSTKNIITLTNEGDFVYDPEDEDTNVVFTLDGEEIAFEDIKEDDVLTITKHPYVDLDDIVTASVVVTRNTVSGTVSRTGDNSVVVDGAEYDINFATAPVEVTKEYTFFLDANGVIVEADELDANINYGVVIKRWTNAEGDDMMRLITATGDVVTYEVKDGEFTTNFGWVLNDNETPEDDEDDYYEFLGWDHEEVVADVEAAIVAYKLTNGKIKAGEDVDTYGGDNQVFKAKTSKLGGYLLDETATKILDLSAYLVDEEEDATTMTIDMFEDDVNYGAYIVDRNSAKSYNFVVVYDGVSNVRPTSALAIVKAEVGDTVVDDEEVTEYTVIKNGEEETLFTDEALVEGDIIQYAPTSKAWVDDITVVFDMSNYDSIEDMIDAVMGEGLVGLDLAKITQDNDTIDVVPYVGLAYSANFNELELFTTFTGGVSATSAVEDLTITGANVYTYDFTAKEEKGVRVEKAVTTMTSSKYTSIYADDSMNAVNWAGYFANEVFAPVVIVREVDNDVTDVFYFVGEWEYVEPAEPDEPAEPVE